MVRKAFCQIDKKQRGGKFNPLGYMGVLVNYCENSPAYRIRHFERNKVCDVGGPIFDEDVLAGWWRQPEEDGEDEEPLSSPVSALIRSCTLFALIRANSRILVPIWRLCLFAICAYVLVNIHIRYAPVRHLCKFIKLNNYDERIEYGELCTLTF